MQLGATAPGPMLREAVSQLARAPAPSPGAAGRTWRVRLAQRPGFAVGTPAAAALWVCVTNDRGEVSYFGRLRLRGVAGTEETDADGGDVLVIVGAKLWAADDGMTAVFRPAGPPKKKRKSRARR